MMLAKLTSTTLNTNSPFFGQISKTAGAKIQFAPPLSECGISVDSFKDGFVIIQSPQLPIASSVLLNFHIRSFLF